jgi:hypothetical protein
MENLDQIIMMIKKWPNDPWLNYAPSVALEDYTKIK